MAVHKNPLFGGDVLWYLATLVVVGALVAGRDTLNLLAQHYRRPKKNHSQSFQKGRSFHNLTTRRFRFKGFRINKFPIISDELFNRARTMNSVI